MVLDDARALWERFLCRIDSWNSMTVPYDCSKDGQSIHLGGLTFLAGRPYLRSRMGAMWDPNNSPPQP
jgi:hypothetical protein